MQPTFSSGIVVAPNGAAAEAQKLEEAEALPMVIAERTMEAWSRSRTASEKKGVPDETPSISLRRIDLSFRGARPFNSGFRKGRAQTGNSSGRDVRIDTRGASEN